MIDGRDRDIWRSAGMENFGISDQRTQVGQHLAQSMISPLWSLEWLSIFGRTCCSFAPHNSFDFSVMTRLFVLVMVCPTKSQTTFSFERMKRFDVLHLLGAAQPMSFA